MRKTRDTWTIAKYMKQIEQGLVSFDYPIQREGEQWNLEQKSLLIHSIACDYPVPPIYALGEKAIVGKGERLVYFLLDGKQRTTNIRAFLKGEYRLDEDVPTFNVNGVEYELANYSYEELPEEVKTAILEFTVDVFKIEDALDSEIESMFYRLNNGTPLTDVQKAKANMGAATATKFKELVKHDTMQKNAVFTPHQIKKADHEVALLQAMMLLDDKYQVGMFGNKQVYDYASSLKGSDSEIFAKTKSTLDYIHEVLGDNVEKTLLKKLHFPMVVWASHEALKANIPSNLFAEWLEGFKAKINSKDNGEFIIVEDEKGNKKKESNPNSWLYKLGCGSGATKVEKVSDRWTATKTEIANFIKQLEKTEREDKAEQERLKKVKEAEKAKAEQDKKKNNSSKPGDVVEGQTELIVEGENIGEVK